MLRSAHRLHAWETVQGLGAEAIRVPASFQSPIVEGINIIHPPA